MNFELLNYYDNDYILENIEETLINHNTENQNQNQNQIQNQKKSYNNELNNETKVNSYNYDFENNEFYELNTIISYFSDDCYREVIGKIIEISLNYDDYTIILLDKYYKPQKPQKLEFINFTTKLKVISTPYDVLQQ